MAGADISRPVEQIRQIRLHLKSTTQPFNSKKGFRLKHLRVLGVKKSLFHFLAWEPTTFIFWSYNPFLGGLKTLIFHGFGVQG